MTCPEGWRVINISIYAESQVGYCNLHAGQRKITHCAYIQGQFRKTIKLNLCIECAGEVKTWPRT